jgi:hypothetical protein
MIPVLMNIHKPSPVAALLYWVLFEKVVVYILSMLEKLAK